MITLEIWTMRSTSESAISEIHFATSVYISSLPLWKQKVNACLDVQFQVSSSLKLVSPGTSLTIMMNI